MIQIRKLPGYKSRDNWIRDFRKRQVRSNTSSKYSDEYLKKLYDRYDLAHSYELLKRRLSGKGPGNSPKGRLIETGLGGEPISISTPVTRKMFLAALEDARIRCRKGDLNGAYRALVQAMTYLSQLRPLFPPGRIGKIATGDSSGLSVDHARDTPPAKELIERHNFQYEVVKGAGVKKLLRDLNKAIIEVLGGGFVENPLTGKRQNVRSEALWRELMEKCAKRVHKASVDSAVMKVRIPGECRARTIRYRVVRPVILRSKEVELLLPPESDDGKKSSVPVLPSGDRPAVTSKKIPPEEKRKSDPRKRPASRKPADKLRETSDPANADDGDLGLMKVAERVLLRLRKDNGEPIEGAQVKLFGPDVGDVAENAPAPSGKDDADVVEPVRVYPLPDLTSDREAADVPKAEDFAPYEAEDMPGGISNGQGDVIAKLPSDLLPDDARKGAQKSLRDDKEKGRPSFEPRFTPRLSINVGLRLKDLRRAAKGKGRSRSMADFILGRGEYDDPFKGLRVRLLPVPLRGGKNGEEMRVMNVEGDALDVKRFLKAVEGLTRYFKDSLIEKDLCFQKEGEATVRLPDDQLFNGRGAWGQKFENQWAIKRIGFHKGEGGVWKLLESWKSRAKRPVTVAVIDTGLDWRHPDFNRSALWRNSGEVPGNGLDDDGNGYPDDVHGWDFVDRDNLPNDTDGHGTFVAGILAARTGNGLGISGIAPGVRIMPLRALGTFGSGSAFDIAEAIVYATDNGADVINLSLGANGRSTLVRMAVAHALRKGVILVAAAGNEGTRTGEILPGGLPGVITVAATDRRDRRVPFANWGAQVDIAAPGVDVLSLRARGTDLLNFIPGVKYRPGSGIVGPHRAYYRASGTSFAAPMVTGAMALVLRNRPDVTHAQAVRMVLNTARDIEVPGLDNFTGHGLLDVAAALQADPARFIKARITGVRVVRRKGRIHLRVFGLADADRFQSARLLLGAGKAPRTWRPFKTRIPRRRQAGPLLDIPARLLRESRVWTLRLIVRHQDGAEREMRYVLQTG